MSDLVGKIAECYAMPEGSFYHAVRGVIEGVEGEWAKLRAAQVIDRWNITWQDHPTSCLTHVRVANIELQEAA